MAGKAIRQKRIAEIPSQDKDGLFLQRAMSGCGAMEMHLRVGSQAPRESQREIKRNHGASLG